MNYKIIIFIPVNLLSDEKVTFHVNISTRIIMFFLLIANFLILQFVSSMPLSLIFNSNPYNLFEFK
jgi:hypothetical protein